MDSFVTIAAPCLAELKEKGSRFLAVALPVVSRDEAENVMERIRKMHFDAEHHCYAYRIGIGRDELMRASDDGEPPGSAGKPILAVIQGAGLTNILVAVTRWFGGTKLGIGGLARVYTESAKKVLELCEKVTRFATISINIWCSYQKLSSVLKVIEQFSAVVDSIDYSDTVCIKVEIRRSWAEQFVVWLRDAAAGQVKITIPHNQLWP